MPFFLQPWLQAILPFFVCLFVFVITITIIIIITTIIIILLVGGLSWLEDESYHLSFDRRWF